MGIRVMPPCCQWLVRAAYFNTSFSSAVERVRATMMAAGLQGGATLQAKLGPLGSVSFAAWAAPGGILLHGWASGRGYLWAKAPAPVSDTCELDGVSVLQPCPGLKRKA